MKRLILSLIILTGVSANGQTLFHNLGNLLNADDTNGLIYAKEINTSFGYKRDSDNRLNGGVFKLDWWVTMQQGAFFSYEEFGDKSAYWSVGYQARTTAFKLMEVAVATGTRQSVNEDFGNVDLFISPSLTYRLVKKQDWSFNITAGVDLVAGTTKPNPYLMASFRF